MKLLYILKIGIILLFIYMFIGCAVFPKKTELSNPLNINNIINLNGKYFMSEIYSGPTKDTTSFWNFSESDLGYNPTLYHELNKKMFTKPLNIDTSKIYTFTLKILNTKKIEINYLKENNILGENSIKYKLKEDGYVYLKNKNFKIRGIPYLLGDFMIRRNRLTLNENNNLLFETSEFNSGGLFLLMVYPYSKMKYEKIYKRVD